MIPRLNLGDALPKSKVQAARAALMPAVLTRLVQNNWSSSRVPQACILGHQADDG